MKVLAFWAMQSILLRCGAYGPAHALLGRFLPRLEGRLRAASFFVGRSAVQAVSQLLGLGLFALLAIIPCWSNYLAATKIAQVVALRTEHAFDARHPFHP